MADPTQKELEESIADLIKYRDRLKAEVVNISRKLRLTSTKINSVLEEHEELNQINAIIVSLEKNQKNNTKKRNKN